MKQFMTFLVSVCMLSVMVSCGSQTASPSLTAEEPDAEIVTLSTNESMQPLENKTIEKNAGKSDGSNTLIAYFSCTGTTRQIAERIAEQTGADLYEITPEIPYTSVDLNYGDSSSRTTL